MAIKLLGDRFPRKNSRRHNSIYNIYWLLTRFKFVQGHLFVRISNGWPSGFQIPFEIQTNCNPISFWPFKSRLVPISDPHCSSYLNTIPYPKRTVSFQIVKILTTSSQFISSIFAVCDPVAQTTFVDTFWCRFWAAFWTVELVVWIGKDQISVLITALTLELTLKQIDQTRIWLNRVMGPTCQLGHLKMPKLDNDL